MRCLFKSGTRLRGGGKKQKTISKQRNPNGSLGSPQLGSLGLPIFFCCFIPFFLTPPLQSLVPGHAYLRKASIWKLRATKICFFQVSNITVFFFHRNVFWFWMHQGQGTYSLFLAQKCSAHSRAALNQRQSLFEWIRYCQYTPFSFNLLYCNNSRLSVFLQLSTTFIQPCPQGL